MGFQTQFFRGKARQTITTNRSMELVTVILSGLLTLISPVGIIAESEIENQIRSQVTSIEELTVRLDNVPSYQIIAGKIDRLRIASRGIQVNSSFRIASLNLETDPFQINLSQLQTTVDQQDLSLFLLKSLKFALNIGFTESDLNRALQSSQIRQLLEDRLAEFLPPQEDGTPTRLFIQDFQIDLLETKRIAVAVKLSNPRVQSVPLASTAENPSFSQINLEFGLKNLNGRTLEIVEPTGTVNDKKLRPSILRTFAKRFSERLDLNQLESVGIFARVLQLKLEPNQIDFVTFMQIDPQ
jgi:hypothetical protein